MVALIIWSISSPPTFTYPSWRSINIIKPAATLLVSAESFAPSWEQFSFFYDRVAFTQQSVTLRKLRRWCELSYLLFNLFSIPFPVMLILLSSITCIWVLLFVYKQFNKYIFNNQRMSWMRQLFVAPVSSYLDLSKTNEECQHFSLSSTF